MAPLQKALFGTSDRPARKRVSLLFSASRPFGSSLFCQSLLLGTSHLTIPSLSQHLPSSPSPTLPRSLSRPSRKPPIIPILRGAFGRSIGSFASWTCLPRPTSSCLRPVEASPPRPLRAVSAYTRIMDSSDDDMPLAGSRRPNGTNGGTHHSLLFTNASHFGSVCLPRSMCLSNHPERVNSIAYSFHSHINPLCSQSPLRRRRHNGPPNSHQR